MLSLYTLYHSCLNNFSSYGLLIFLKREKLIYPIVFCIYLWTDLTRLFIDLFPLCQNWFVVRQEDYLSSDVVLHVSKAVRVGTPGLLWQDVSGQELTLSFVWGVCGS